MTVQRKIIVMIMMTVVIMMVASLPFAYGKWVSYRRADLARRCAASLRDKDWDELQSTAKQWSNWDTHNGDAWMFRAEAAQAKNDWAEAADAYWQVPTDDPRAIPAMIELSKLAFSRLNRPLLGIDACQRILSIDPRAAGAHKQLIGFYATTLQRQPLVQQIRAAIKAEHEPREAYVYYFLLNSLRSKNAIELIGHWLEAAPESELFRVALVLQLPEPKTDSPDTPSPQQEDEHHEITRGRSKLQLVDELLEKYPKNLELLAYKAESGIDVGDVAAATTWLSQAPDSADSDSRFWRIKGWLHESNNELVEANQAYRKSLEIHPVDWITMNRLAVVERRRGNIAEVERLTKLVERCNELRKAIRTLSSLDLVTPPILMELAKLYHDCGDQQVGPALGRRLRGTRVAN